MSSAGKKSSLIMMKRNRERKEREQKEGTSRAERTIQVVVEARQHQNVSERGSRFKMSVSEDHASCWVHKDLTVTTKQIHNQALLKTVKRWVGEGGKETLVGAPDAYILLEAIEELPKRTTAGAATFLVKVKVHRGESANEEADIQAKKSCYRQRC